MSKQPLDVLCEIHIQGRQGESSASLFTKRKGASATDKPACSFSPTRTDAVRFLQFRDQTSRQNVSASTPIYHIVAGG